MKMIAAVDENWALGLKGSLLVRIPADHRMFRQETLGKVVVYGRKTLETFPGQQVLDQRENIVLSSNPAYTVKGARMARSLEDLLEILKEYPTDDVYIIGGASVYQMMLPYADLCHITKIDRAYEADCYFPNLDKDPEWHITADSEEQTYFDISYHFLQYERIKK